MDPCAYDYFPSRIYRLLTELGPDTLVSIEEIAELLGIQAILLQQWSGLVGLKPFILTPNGGAYRWGDVVTCLSKQI